MFIDLVGYAGAALVLIAYGLTASGRWPATGALAAVSNLAAGAALALNGLHHGAMLSVVVNGVWSLIGLSALLRLVVSLRRNRNHEA